MDLEESIRVILENKPSSVEVWKGPPMKATDVNAATALRQVEWNLTQYYQLNYVSILPNGGDWDVLERVIRQISYGMVLETDISRRDLCYRNGNKLDELKERDTDGWLCDLGQIESLATEMIALRLLNIRPPILQAAVFVSEDMETAKYYRRPENVAADVKKFMRKKWSRTVGRLIAVTITEIAAVLGALQHRSEKSREQLKE